MDKILEFLQGSPLIYAGCQFWNGCCSLVSVILGQTPQGMKGEAWTFVTTSIYPIFLALGIALMSMFFVFGYARDSADIRQAMTLENSIFMFVRLIFGNMLVTGALIWIPRFISWAGNIVAQIIGVTSTNSLGTLNSQDIVQGADAVTFLGTGSLTSWLIAFVFFVICVVGGFMLIMPVYKRIFNLLVLIPLAPVALAGIAGGKGMTHTAASFVKEFLATCFEIVVIALVLVIGGYFISEPTFRDVFQGIDKIAGNTASMFEAILSILILTTAVKGTNALIRKALGL